MRDKIGLYYQNLILRRSHINTDRVFYSSIKYGSSRMIAFDSFRSIGQLKWI